MKNSIRIFFFLMLCSLSARQQGLNDSLRAIRIDSLTAIIKQQKGDSLEVNALFKLSLPETRSDSAGAKYARQGLALAQKIKYKRGEADCYYSLGNGYSHIKSQSQAITYYFNALRIYTEI